MRRTNRILMARTKTCVRKRRPQLAKKTIRPTVRGVVSNPTHGVYLPRVYVQNTPAKAVARELNLYRRRRARVKNQSIRKSQQCVSNTKQGRQCKRRTAHTNKCWTHLAWQDNLRIKPSNIVNAGKGLFAWTKPILARKKFTKYTGRKMTAREVTQKYGQGLAEYALCDRGRCIDANYTTDAAGRFSNDSRGSRYRNNAEYRGRNYKFYLKSTKRVRPHEEIFCNYGNSYWKEK